MKEFVITSRDEGGRLDKFLKGILGNATGGFIYKMLRKKNILLNGKKADGTEKLVKNDVVCLYLSDDTFEKFKTTLPSSKKIPGNARNLKEKSQGKEEQQKALDLSKVCVLYEDEDLLLVNKPVGILSQKASKDDVSMNELLISYCIQKGSMTKEDLLTFTPSVCNRLDRNTSGILTFGKTRKGAQYLSAALKERSAHKYYVCVVEGVVTSRGRMEAALKKNTKTNKVSIRSIASKKEVKPEEEYILTEYMPFSNNGKYTLLKIQLHTGKTHQIRAHLAFLGHGIVGDVKYGSRPVGALHHQLLHCMELSLPGREVIHAPLPRELETYLVKEGLWEPGKQEALEALH
ncbi:MAG: RluA family pseudouridine synthase [Lachnospiraceae bacterium]|nr:RluA family pseudouridine synthase [Lachnospiraceae bacterium]